MYIGFFDNEMKQEPKDKVEKMSVWDFVKNYKLDFKEIYVLGSEAKADHQDYKKEMWFCPIKANSEMEDIEETLKNDLFVNLKDNPISFEYCKEHSKPHMIIYVEISTKLKEERGIE